LVFGVLYLHKYFGNFTYFISHAKSIYLKNIGRNRGNTTYQDVFKEHLRVFNDFADYCKENGCPDLVMKLLE